MRGMKNNYDDESSRFRVIPSILRCRKEEKRITKICKQSFKKRFSRASYHLTIYQKFSDLYVFHIHQEPVSMEHFFLPSIPVLDV